MVKVILNLAKLNNKEFSRLVTSLLRDWQGVKATVDDPVLTKLKNRLTQQSEVFYQGLVEVKDSTTAKAIEEADQQRDNNLQFLAEMVKWGRLATTSEAKEAYKVLMPLFKDVRKIKKSNYEEESLLLNGLLDQLKKPEYQTHLRNLDLMKAFQNLTKSQEAFDALLAKRQTTKTTKVVYDNKKSRKDLQATYDQVDKYLSVMADEATPVAYGKLYKIFVANEAVFKPLTASKKNKDKADQTPPVSDGVNPSPDHPEA